MIATQQEYSFKLKFLKYFEIVKINYLNNTAYMLDVLGSAGLIMFRVWVFSQLYRVAFASQQASQIGGLTLGQTIWTLALTQSFFVSNRTRILVKQITNEVKNGTIAYTMNRPYNYILFSFFGNFGVLGSRVIISTILSGLVALILVGVINFNIIGLAAGIVLFLFGVCMNTLIALIMGLLAFWTEETSAYRWIYDKFNWLFGGVFIPLTVFPETLKKISEILPFSQMFYHPSLMIVKFNASDFVKFLLIELGWILALSLVANFVYGRGVKNISVNGG